MTIVQFICANTSGNILLSTSDDSGKGTCYLSDTLSANYVLPARSSSALHQSYYSQCYNPVIINITISLPTVWVNNHTNSSNYSSCLYRLLVGKPEGRRPLGRPRRRSVDNIRMALVEVGWGDVDWIGLAQDTERWRALVTSVLNLRVP
jgi:hypothetical protein